MFLLTCQFYLFACPSLDQCPLKKITPFAVLLLVSMIFLNICEWCLDLWICGPVRIVVTYLFIILPFKSINMQVKSIVMFLTNCDGHLFCWNSAALLHFLASWWKKKKKKNFEFFWFGSLDGYARFRESVLLVLSIVKI